MHIDGPSLSAQAECEAVLRSLPLWFGVEESLLMYARDSARLPSFALFQEAHVVGFVSLLQHFPRAWEVHCIAIRAESRGKGHGRRLLTFAERWLGGQGATVLQIKTIAETKDDPSYSQTRKFYSRLGYEPLEVFPELWGPTNPCLQLIKVLPTGR